MQLTLNERNAWHADSQARSGSFDRSTTNIQ